MVTVCPEILNYERNGRDDGILLLASDGLWDVFENLDAGQLFVSRLPVGVLLEEVVYLLGGLRAKGHVRPVFHIRVTPT